MKKTLLTPLLATLFLLGGLSTAQADAPPKEALCKSCHGPGGAKPLVPAYPKLNGQTKEYLISSMKAYKAGQRQGGMSMVMTQQAKMLSDEEIVALAEYYSKQP